MTWKIEWDDRARRELRRLDWQVQRDILRYFSERIATDQDPAVLVSPCGMSCRAYGVTVLVIIEPYATLKMTTW